MSAPGAAETEARTDVLIAGAGPAGLTLACELRRRGVDCRLIDRFLEYPVTSRALGCQPRTLEVFDDLGIVQQVLAEGQTILGANFYRGDALVGKFRLQMDATGHPDTPYLGILVQNQAVTERILRERLSALGGEVERGQELRDFREVEGGVVADVADVRMGAVRQIRARWLVGCDGAHSLVRKALGLTFEGNTYPEHLVLADVELEAGLPKDATSIWINEEGMLAAFPFPESRLWRLAAVVKPDGAGEVPAASLELFQQLFAERAGSTRVRPTKAIWLSNFKVNRRMVNHYRKGRVFVAGDAAHIHSPSGGQGMNTGIQDAYNLGWKLALVARGRAAPALLETYEEERLPIARHVLDQTNTNHTLTSSTNPIAQFVSQHLLMPLMELPAVTNAVMRRGAELDLNYRGRSLAREHEVPLGRIKLALRRDGEEPGVGDWLGFHRGPRAGDRAPDWPCVDASTGAPRRIFDQLRGPHFTLLLFDGMAHTDAGYVQMTETASRIRSAFGAEVQPCVIASSGERPAALTWNGATLLDPEQRAHALYGAGSECLYLVRPDGYVAFRSQPPSLEHLSQYLDGLFQRGTARLLERSGETSRRAEA